MPFSPLVKCWNPSDWRRLGETSNGEVGEFRISFHMVATVIWSSFVVLIGIEGATDGFDFTPHTRKSGAVSLTQNIKNDILGVMCQNRKLTMLFVGRY